MNENRTFLGRGWSFPPALDKDGTPPDDDDGDGNTSSNPMG